MKAEALAATLELVDAIWATSFVSCHHLSTVGSLLRSFTTFEQTSWADASISAGGVQMLGICRFTNAYFFQPYIDYSSLALPESCMEALL